MQQNYYNKNIKICKHKSGNPDHCDREDFYDGLEAS
jgi:hypothetical protein